MSLTGLDLQHATIRQLQDGLSAGDFTSLDLVKVSDLYYHTIYTVYPLSLLTWYCILILQAYMSRIGEVNSVLNAVIAISPAAFKAARELDEERRQGKTRSILHGIPIAIKDNIATRVEDGMDTTAGSFALQGAHVPSDADCVARLREAGAILLCTRPFSTGTAITATLILLSS